MKCPECGVDRTRCLQTNNFGDATRRYRKCLACNHRFVTIETTGQIQVEDNKVMGIVLKEFASG